MAKKLAVAYIRVSTEGQNKEDAYGKELQRAAILDYADKNGYIIDRWYEEVGSGAKERPVLEGILFSDAVSNPPFDALIVYKQDRIARDMTLFFSYMYQLKKKNVELVSVHDDVDMQDPMWGIRMALIQMIAEQERKNIALRTMAGKAVKAQSGGYVGGRPPFGYNIINGDLIVNEEEAEVVRLIFSWLDSGLGLRAVATNLNRLGYKTKKGNDYNYSAVRSIRDNKKLYQGWYRYGDMEYTVGKHKPIIDGLDKEDDYEITIE